MRTARTVAPTLDEAVLRQWIGNTQQASDVITLQTCRRMADTVGYEKLLNTGDSLPALWHWLFFHASVSTSELAQDGHPRRGDFLPPVALAGRMWAGGRVTFESPLLIGSEATKDSRIIAVERKSGRSGELCFVTVEHTIRQQDEVRLVEEHDIVYREAAHRHAIVETPDRSTIRAAGALTERTEPTVLKVSPSVTALFRYSALTFNAHRIHYDRDYCLKEESYAGLVVHGPLTATLMANLAENCSSQPLKTFDYRALGALLDTETFTITADSAGPVMSIAARKESGQVAMQATAGF